MFTLKNAQVIRGSDAHAKAGLGFAIDWKADYEDFQIFFDGACTKIYTGYQGGYWLHVKELKRPEREWQFCHLSKYKVSVGQQVKNGDIVAVTGGRPGDLPSAGHITSGKHLHGQLFVHGSRVKPEGYLKDYLNQTNPQPMEKIGSKNVPLYFATYLGSYSKPEDDKYWGELDSASLLKALCTGQEYKDRANRQSVAITGAPFSEQDINNFVAYRFPQWQIINKALERAKK